MTREAPTSQATPTSSPDQVAPAPVLQTTPTNTGIKLPSIAESLADTAERLDRLVLTHQGVSDAAELQERAGRLLNFAINHIFALGRAAPELVAPYLRGHPRTTISDPVSYWTSWVSPWIVSIGGHGPPDISRDWLTAKSEPGDMTPASKRKWEALQEASKQKDPVAAMRRVWENDPTPLERDSVHIPTKNFPVPISEMDDYQQHMLLRKSCECWAENCRVASKLCRDAAAEPPAAASEAPASLGRERYAAEGDPNFDALLANAGMPAPDLAKLLRKEWRKGATDDAVTAWLKRHRGNNPDCAYDTGKEDEPRPQNHARYLYYPYGRNGVLELLRNKYPVTVG